VTERRRVLGKRTSKPERVAWYYAIAAAGRRLPDCVRGSEAAKVGARGRAGVPSRFRTGQAVSVSVVHRWYTRTCPRARACTTDRPSIWDYGCWMVTRLGLEPRTQRLRGSRPFCRGLESRGGSRLTPASLSRR